MTLPVRRLLFSCMTLWCTLGSCERPDPENAQPPTATEARELSLPLAASPYQPGTIGIVYVDDRVVEKNFDPMVRD